MTPYESSFWIVLILVALSIFRAQWQGEENRASAQKDTSNNVPLSDKKEKRDVSFDI
ncbi:MAG: hypothetical protein HYW65_04455 [Candidatus Liptonbacteria bacterium]|nr:hypothetical protein [Candidatus Liptonbacteria bacterium]